MDCSVKDGELPEYDGTVIYLNAEKDCDLNIKARNLEILRDIAPNTQVTNFPDHAHNDLFFDAALIPKYLEMMSKC